jgi:hypothetical protein
MMSQQQRKNKTDRSMWRVNFFRWQRQWCSDNNTSTFHWVTDALDEAAHFSQPQASLQEQL